MCGPSNKQRRCLRPVFDNFKYEGGEAMAVLLRSASSHSSMFIFNCSLLVDLTFHRLPTLLLGLLFVLRVDAAEQSNPSQPYHR